METLADSIDTLTMKYSDIKKVKKFTDDWRGVVEHISRGEADFEIGDYRYIKECQIDQIQQEELKSDKYALGCCHAWFLADVLNIDSTVLVALHEAEAYEAIGILILSMGKLEAFQKEYSRIDGYGHHFALYDGYAHELPANYIGFRIN